MKDEENNERKKKSTSQIMQKNSHKPFNRYAQIQQTPQFKTPIANTHSNKISGSIDKIFSNSYYQNKNNDLSTPRGIPLTNPILVIPSTPIRRQKTLSASINIDSDSDLQDTSKLKPKSLPVSTKRAFTIPTLALNGLIDKLTQSKRSKIVDFIEFETLPTNEHPVSKEIDTELHSKFFIKQGIHSICN